ncbi:hypothetical protein EZV62_016986 [Acer yangbiense]|uniref:Uncharacterized protein n=1 Tax=Acer yangbiense TaxID=1000413 RepID=A0A5C7HQ15_9ROSI|nr:hypothetical protein EZV62_016986 [Acer yangbiense]
MPSSDRPSELQEPVSQRRFSVTEKFLILSGGYWVKSMLSFSLLPFRRKSQRDPETASRVGTLQRSSSRLISIRNLSSHGIQCIDGSLSLCGPSKQYTVSYGDRSWGSSIARIGCGPEEIAVSSIHCYPSTSNCSGLGWLESEVLMLAVGNVGVYPSLICGCAPHSPSTSIAGLLPHMAAPAYSPVLPKLSGSMKVCHRILPVLASNMARLPRKVQNSST